MRLQDEQNWTRDISKQELLKLLGLIFTSWEIDGETVETVSGFIFLAPKSLQMVIAAMKLKDANSLERELWPT